MALSYPRRRRSLQKRSQKEAEAQVLRLSTLYAVLDRSAAIRVPHLRAALALWDYAERSAAGSSAGVSACPSPTSSSRRSARGAATATAISGLFGRHRSAEELHQALDLLRDLGLVVRRVEATGGRSATLWAACDGRETNETSE